MLIPLLQRTRHNVLRHSSRWSYYARRQFTVLGIETSCDDTSVALLHIPTNPTEPVTFPFHERITSDTRAFGGIEPITALRSHRANLAPLLQRAFKAYPSTPDIIAVTRGPGLISSLDIGLQTAKGLAVAWGIPLVAVNHMQAHALTIRLCDAMEGRRKPMKEKFWSLLVSGGHSMFVESKGLTEHAVLVDTMDIAVGDALDKCARTIVPEAFMAEAQEVSFGRILERFVFGDVVGSGAGSWLPKLADSSRCILGLKVDSESPYDWSNVEQKKYKWEIKTPLTKSKHKELTAFSFSSFPSQVVKIMEKTGGNMDVEQRRMLGYKVMESAFLHLAIQGCSALENTPRSVLVVSGGVASNGFLKYMYAFPESDFNMNRLTSERLRKHLNTTGRELVEIRYPPIELCTDNAAMIAWTGWEMYEAGWESELNAQPLKKWWLDKMPASERDVQPNVKPNGKFYAEFGWGILTVPGWRRRNPQVEHVKPEVTPDGEQRGDL